MEVARALAQRLPGSRIRPNAYGGATLVFELDGAWLDARVLEGPAVEVFIRTLDVGVALKITGAERNVALPRNMVNGQAVGPSLAEVALAFAQLEVSKTRADLVIELDADDPLAALWIDPPAEAALIAALSPMVVDGLVWTYAELQSFVFELAAAEVSFSRRGGELDRLHRAFVAAATLAARPHRLGRAWLEAARALGGTTTVDRWDLADAGGEFAATIDRGAAAVRVDNLRRLPGDDDDHRGLYTRVRARRVAADGDRWAIWRRDLPRAHRPRPGRGTDDVDLPELDACATDAERLIARARAHAALLEAAAPSAVGTVDDGLELWWPGLVDDLARLGPAVELVARLAGELDASAGPYR